MKRNPLAIAFGLSLRELRIRFDMKVSDLATAIELNESHYRVIESGATTMHINKSMEVCVGFNSLLVENGSKTLLTYEGVEKIILGISYVNSFYVKTKESYSINYFEKTKVIENLKNFEPKLYLLIRKFDDAQIFEMINKNNEELQKVFDKASLDVLVNSFVTDYSNFGGTPEDLKNNFTNQFFDDIPSYYIHFLKNIKDDLKSLPVEIAFSELNNWEIKNRDSFSSLVSVVRKPLQILSERRLAIYKYSYLWGKNFKSAKILFLENDLDGYKGSLKDVFINHLRKGYSDEVPLDFDEKINKISFKLIKKDSYNKALKLLKNKSTKTNEVSHYDATWVFSHKNLSNIGFQAKEEKAEGDYYNLKHGVSLHFAETVKFIIDFNKIWNE